MLPGQCVADWRNTKHNSSKASTHREVGPEALGAHGALQLGVQVLAAVGQRHLWYGVAGGRLPVVAQQPVLAAELQVAHVAGEQLQPDVGEAVGGAGAAVRERGAAHPAEPQLRQVGLGVPPDGVRFSSSLSSMISSASRLHCSSSLPSAAPFPLRACPSSSSTSTFPNASPPSLWTSAATPPPPAATDATCRPPRGSPEEDVGAQASAPS
ncbi:hypothetical protein EYF80_016506 [Liparis tanakae]|uniref:Uncharacterized protein n=1 Tax=Liparis tanakae TaxID=230148 RepID=A0A4Z2I8C0_9TELE|nr:hypothetical protein EYF80_016506 [Liparis tanakae]